MNGILTDGMCYYFFRLVGRSRLYYSFPQLLDEDFDLESLYELCGRVQVALQGLDVFANDDDNDEYYNLLPPGEYVACVCFLC